MEVMKAIYLTKYGASSEAFEFRETAVPTPKDDEVLIKVAFSGINFADIIARRGLYPDAPKNPAVLGYDVAGTVSALGKNVQHLRIGQQVIAMTRFGGYAEYAVSHHNGVCALPQGIDLASGTVLATQACTAYYCAEECTTLHKGDRVLIQAAAGGVGSILVQIAKHRGCYVYGTASTDKLAYLRDAGVDSPIDYTKEDFYQHIKSSGKDLDVVFDSLGGMSFKKANQLLGPGGKMICYGAADQLASIKNKLKLLSLAYGFGLFSPISLLMQSKSIITINMLRIADYKPNVFNEVLLQVVKMAELGIIKPRVSKIFSAKDISQAHDFVESRKSTGKVVLSWNE